MNLNHNSSDELVKVLEDFISSCKLEDKVILDHICYKCSTKDSYEQIKTSLELSEKFLYTSIISKRRISSVGLRDGVTTKFGSITLLELNDQKPDGSQIEGFDHIEIMPIKGYTCEGLAKVAEENGYKVEVSVRPHHTTYDVCIDKYTIRFTSELLIDKIKKEMNY